MSRWVAIEVIEVLHATDKALLVFIADDEGDQVERWIPLSQIDLGQSEVQDVGDAGKLIISAWIAAKNDIPISPESVIPARMIKLNILRDIYRQLALKFHPDRNKGKGAKDIMIGINEFWERIRAAFEER